MTEDITPKRGEVWIGPDGRTVKVMALVDDYVMARYKGAMPWLLFLKEFLRDFHKKVGGDD